MNMGEILDRYDKKHHGYSESRLNTWIQWIA